MVDFLTRSLRTRLCQSMIDREELLCGARPIAHRGLPSLLDRPRSLPVATGNHVFTHGIRSVVPSAYALDSDIAGPLEGDAALRAKTMANPDPTVNRKAIIMNKDNLSEGLTRGVEIVPELPRLSLFMILPAFYGINFR